MDHECSWVFLSVGFQHAYPVPFSLSPYLINASLISKCEEPGDILLFLTGEVEIEDACRSIRSEIERTADPTKVNASGSQILIDTQSLLAHVAKA